MGPGWTKNRPSRGSTEAAIPVTGLETCREIRGLGDRFLGEAYILQGSANSLLEHLLTQAIESRFFPALLGALHQEGGEGELILEQNDGTRRVFWAKGDLVYLQSDAAGEQFGNYLIRQGILDRNALQELLSAKDDLRFGDKVVHWGLVTVEERDRLLQRLLEQILLNALEHPLVNVIWEPGPIEEKLSSDLRFRLDHRALIWEAFQQIRDLTFLVELLYSEPDWRWESKDELLVALSDLSLTPEMAFALSMLGREPLGFEAFMSITGMEEDDAARLIVALWALGSLSLKEGKMPALPPGQPGRTRGVDPAVFSTGQMPIIDSSPPFPPPPHAVPGRPAPVSLYPPAPAPATAAPPPLANIPLSWSSEPPPLPPQPPVFQKPLPPPPPASTWGTLPERARGTEAAPPQVKPELPPPQAQEPEDEDPFFDAPVHVEGHGTPGEGTPSDRARKLVKTAKIFLIQGHTGEAVRALEDAVKLDPESRGSFEAWLMLGKLRLTNPAWMNRAIEAFQMATRVNPLVGEPWALMGELYLKKGFKSNADSCYRRALEMDPSIPVPTGIDLSHNSNPSSPRPEGNGPGLMGRIKGLFS